MNRTFSRKEAAKKLGTTAAALKDLETNGTVVPLRDEKKRPRYTAEMIEALRAVVAPMAAPLYVVPPPTPAPMPPPEPYFAPPPVAQYTPPPPAPSAELSPDELHTLGGQFGEALHAEAVRWNVPADEILRRWAWSPTTPPVPPTFAPLLSAWAHRTGRTSADLWEMLQGYVPQWLRALDPYAGDGPYEPPRPTYPVSQPSHGYNPSPALSSGQYSAPQFPTPYPAAYMPPPQARPRFTQPRAPGYFPTQQWGASGLMPSPFQVAQPLSSPVLDARNALEIARIEQERRRLERLSEAEEQERIRAEEREAARMANLERAQALAVAQAQAEAQQRDKLTALQWEEHQRQIAAQSEAARQHAELEQRQRAEAEQIERTVAQVVAQLPSFIPFEAVESIRQNIWAAVAGKPAGVVAVIAKDIADRAVMPFRAAQEAEAARQQIANAVVGFERAAYVVLGADAVMAAENAVRSFLASGGADGMSYQTAVAEARRHRDAALEPYRHAAEEQNAARQIENVIMMKSYDARSRAQELLRAAGVEGFSAIEAVVARAVELTRSRAAQLNPAMGLYQYNEQIGELLMAAVEEAVREVG